MTYSVYQHWDPLKGMAVGKSYPPELYDYIKNERVRKVFYQIAEETEEDYQKLINLLHSFGVQTVRPDLDNVISMAKSSIKNNTPIRRPYEMQPRDYSIMLGETFYYHADAIANKPIIDLIKQQGNIVRNSINTGFKYANNSIKINAAMTSRIGKDLIIGTIDHTETTDNLEELQNDLQSK